MTASSIALQLQAIKSIVKGATEPLTRPYTRPSILFDPKEAADIDIETIHNIAYSGVEVLENVDERFRHHKNELFGHRSREFDRELISREENNRVNASINSYLRLLSGHLHLPSASKTLEYLIRRYKIHVYNIEELILCALPYHDTHAFVRIVQLIDLGNSRWRFLGGVKATGALLPRKVIVQQCIRDMGVLEVLCNYATPTKKYQPSMPVITFCTAVVVEVFGSLSTIGSDAVKRILPFVVSGLQSGTKGISDYKAGALMIAGLLANRVALSPKLVKSFVRSISELARADANESSDLQCSQMSIIALINIVQLQSVETLPKKAVDILKEIRDLSGILSGLIRKFNIDGFLTVLLVSLVDYSNSDSLCKLAVISIVESVPVGGLVHHIVPRLLFSCLRLSQNSNASESSESGNWAKQILGVIHEKYPQELRSSFHKFVEDKKVQSKGESWVFDTLCRMLDGNIHATSEISDSRIWFALEHSKAEIRRAALNSFDTSTILNSRVVNPQRLVSIQDVVLRRLCDDDLSVVQAALSLDRLSDLISSPLLFEAFKNVLLRCTRVLLSDASNDFSLASDIAISCLRHAVSFVQNWNDFVEELATMMFPLLLVLPKTKRLNLKAQELSQEIKWPFYKNLVSVHGAEKKPTQAWLSSVNMTVVSSLADVFMANTQEHIHWLTNCCSSSEISRTLLFLILLHSLMEKNVSWLPAMYDACFAFLKKEWEALKNGGELLSGGEFNISILEGGCLQLLDQLHVTNLKELNAKVLVCILWRLLKAYILAMPGNASLDDNDEWIRNLRDIFVLFSECHLKHVFKEHLHYLLLNCRLSPILFLLKFITKEGVSSAVQVQSLNSLTLLSSSSDENFALHLLAEFPSILVPLSSEIQDVRTAALNYVEELLTLCSRVKGAGRKNGNIEPWSPFIDELLSMVVQQKKLILSDREFLPSLLTSILSASYQSLLLSNNARQRFEKSTRENILRFILLTAVKLPSYAQLKILSLVKEVGDAILRIKDMTSLLSELLQRRCAFSYGFERPCPKLSKIDVDILCLLIEICCMPTSSDILDVEGYILRALRIEDTKSDDPAILWPCLTVLRKLNDRLYGSLRAEMQEELLQELVLLHCNDNLDIQNAATDALLRINISCSSFSALIDYALGFEVPPDDSAHRKKKSVTHRMPDSICRGKNALRFLISILDILLLKKDIQNRSSLIRPLFELLEKSFSNEWALALEHEKWLQHSLGVSETMSSTICYIQQTIFLILEDIVASLSASDISPNDNILKKSSIVLLVKCAQSATDVTTRNHAFSLFATVSKVVPDKVLDLLPDVLAAISRSTITQSDSHSNRVFEDFITAIVPCWLSRTNSFVPLLQIFVNVMPDVALHRRLTIVVQLLRTIGEFSSLGSLFFLLFHSLVSRERLPSSDDEMHSSDLITSATQAEWEYLFAIQVCEQYTCMIWLPSLVMLLKQLEADNPDLGQFKQLQVAMKFIFEKLQDPELLFKLESGEDSYIIQGTLGELMEKVVYHSQLVDSRRKRIALPTVIKKELKDLIHAVLTCITKGMTLSTFFGSVIRLLGHANNGVRKKAVQLLCEAVKDFSAIKQKKVTESIMYPNSSWQHLDESSLDSFGTLCLEILQLTDDSNDDLSLKLAAVAALEVLANRFPSDHAVFNMCLNSVTKSILSDDVSVASGCIRTAGALINVLGSRALPELPQIMENVLKKSRRVPSDSVTNTDNTSIRSTSKESVMLSTTVILEALIQKLGAFLNPYLQDIVELMVLHPDFVSGSSQKLKQNADAIRRLLTEKIPVRLALSPILKVYTEAVISGDSSLSITFEMLTNFVGRMDRASVRSYHATLFDLCLRALDLRCQHLPSIKKINVVEKHVIDALIALTMKLTETMFKPLFIRCIEWAESNVEESDCIRGMNRNRAITFYGLVNKLAENHRSLFVPYFKYLRDGCVLHLTDGDVKNVDHFRKKKKAKMHNTEIKGREDSHALSLGKWQLRALVLSSLHKCFLYDTGSLKFLDSPNFQLLLQPIVSQLAVEPPASLEDFVDMPTVNEVDDLLVSCIGQMAVTSGSDLLWKPLNYEVLMQTRSEMVRSRILGLRIVKYLVENLKEEYLVLLAETLPFLVELLEDVELPVKTLAQEILKELESMSGESLRQYF